MNENLKFFIYLFVMAAVTYLVRMVPLIFCRKKIRNRFIRSFLYYIPYAVLTVMTVPGILYSTGSLPSAIVGALVSIILAVSNRSLIIVATGASFAVLLFEIVAPHILNLSL